MQEEHAAALAEYEAQLAEYEAECEAAGVEPEYEPVYDVDYDFDYEVDYDFGGGGRFDGFDFGGFGD